MKTFRQEYKQARTYLIICIIFLLVNASMVVYALYNGNKLYLVVNSVGTISSICGIILRKLEMMKAKRYMVFDDFLITQTPQS